MKRAIVVLVLSTIMVTSAVARHHIWVGGKGMGPFGASIAGTNGGGGGGSSCSGTLNLSTGCSQLVAYGGLF